MSNAFRLIHGGRQDTGAGADISPCGKYRYTLWRRWSEYGPLATFVMLNPSTADATVDDPTIRKCMGFAKRWGKSGIWVVNLFALRSTDPMGLLSVSEPFGPNNWDWLRAAAEHDEVVCAWGATGGAKVQNLIKWRIASVLPLLANASGNRGLFCLGKAKNGAPRHPLMLSYDTPLQAYEAFK